MLTKWLNDFITPTPVLQKRKLRLREGNLVAQPPTPRKRWSPNCNSTSNMAVDTAHLLGATSGSPLLLHGMGGFLRSYREPLRKGGRWSSVGSGRSSNRESEVPTSRHLPVAFMVLPSPDAMHAHPLQKSSMKKMFGTSLVAQWLRCHLPVQGVRAQFLVRELRSLMPWDQKTKNIKQK